MNAREAIKLSIDSSSMVSLSYLEDLTDAEMLHRPAKGANHINWQIGHLIVAENELVNKAAPGAMPPLPEGFAAKYKKETSTSDDPKAFYTKAQLLDIHKTQRAATLAALEKITDADLDRASGLDWAPNVAALFSLQGGHWLMHAGQWAVVRRQLGRAPLF